MDTGGGGRWKRGQGNNRHPYLEAEGIGVLGRGGCWVGGGVKGSRGSSQVCWEHHGPNQHGDFQAPTCFKKPSSSFLEPTDLRGQGRRILDKEAGSEQQLEGSGCGAPRALPIPSHPCRPIPHQLQGPQPVLGLDAHLPALLLLSPEVPDLGGMHAAPASHPAPLMVISQPQLYCPASLQAWS